MKEKMKLPLTSLPPAGQDVITMVNAIRQEKMAHINVDPFPVPVAFQGFRHPSAGLGPYPNEGEYRNNVPEFLRYYLANA